MEDNPFAIGPLFAIRHSLFALSNLLPRRYHRRALPGDEPMNAPAQIVPPYRHTPLFPLGPDTTTYRKLTNDGVRVEKAFGRVGGVVGREALRLLAAQGFIPLNHLLRPGHLAQLRAILDDPQ